jgi:alkylation response protein AidB-like acyl-CoA dehydrogenase
MRFADEALPPALRDLRARVRAFLEAERVAGSFTPMVDSWTRFDAAFSLKCAEQGLLGMTLPRKYGGHGRSALERHVVVEEMLAAGAPVGAHWIADRQSGGQILEFGSEAARQRLLPRITEGRCFFSIGMSEPQAGSDLSAVRTRAERHGDHWRLLGRKIWTTNAHRSDYMVALARTSPPGPDRHAGFTQFIVDLKGAGVTVSPIADLGGEAEFNEVLLDGAPVADDFVLGTVGGGWALVMHELAAERSGPERFLSTFPLLVALVRRLGAEGGDAAAEAIGRLVAHLATLRAMSVTVAGMLAGGESPELEAVLVKDLGNGFEREVPEIARRLAPPRAAGDEYEAALARAVLRSPAFTLRGGTRELLRGVIARRLGSL